MMLRAFRGQLSSLGAIMIGCTALLTSAMSGCGGNLAFDDPLAPVPTAVDPDEIEPAVLRAEWTLSPEEPDPLSLAPGIDGHHVYAVYGTVLRTYRLSDGTPRWTADFSSPPLLPPLPLASGVAIAVANRWEILGFDGRVDSLIRLTEPPIDALIVGATRLLQINTFGVTLYQPGLEVVAADEADLQQAALEQAAADAVAPPPAQPAHPSPPIWEHAIPLASALSISPDGAIAIVTTSSGRLHALRTLDGGSLWTVDADQDQGPANVQPLRVAIDGERVYYSGTDQRLHAVRLTDGARVWSSNGLGIELATAPTVIGDVVWVSALDAIVRGFSTRGGSQLFRAKIESRSYIDLVSWGPWVIASPVDGDWTFVRAPLAARSPSDPGSPTSFTISADGRLELRPGLSPEGVIVADSSGSLQLLRAAERPPEQAIGSAENR